MGRGAIGALALLLLCLLPRGIPQEVPDATAPATVAHDADGSPEIDDPEGEYEKKDPPPVQPCDDGIGPDPNRMPPALPDSQGDSGDTAESESGGGGIGSILSRVVRHVVSKYSNIDMQTGRPFEKPKSQRIPMCPGAKPRRPIPGVDCEIPSPEEKLNCCDCGCGCCSMLRRVAKRAANKFRNIDMTNGKPFKALPSCEELHALRVPQKRDDLPLKSLLAEKAAKAKEKTVV